MHFRAIIINSKSIAKFYSGVKNCDLTVAVSIFQGGTALGSPKFNFLSNCFSYLNSIVLLFT